MGIRKQGNPRGSDAGVAERREQAFELRLGGAAYRQIGEQLGISHQRAYQLVQEAIDDLNESTREKAEQLRRIQSERLERLLIGLWPRRREPIVTDRILRILERQAKLWGIEAPTRIEGDFHFTSLNEYLRSLPDPSLDPEPPGLVLRDVPRLDAVVEAEEDPRSGTG